MNLGYDRVNLLPILSILDKSFQVADPESRTKYDINKLKEWPGFNISLPTEYKDETAYYRVPPITKHMMLQVRLVFCRQIKYAPPWPISTDIGPLIEICVEPTFLFVCVLTH